MGAIFESKYPARCGVCDTFVPAGEMVTYVDDEIAHVACPSPSKSGDTDICPKCFMTIAVNGECGGCCE